MDWCLNLTALTQKLQLLQLQRWGHQSIILAKTFQNLHENQNNLESVVLLNSVNINNKRKISCKKMQKHIACGIKSPGETVAQELLRPCSMLISDRRDS